MTRYLLLKLTLVRKELDMEKSPWPLRTTSIFNCGATAGEQVNCQRKPTKGASQISFRQILQYNVRQTCCQRWVKVSRRKSWLWNDKAKGAKTVKRPLVPEAQQQPIPGCSFSGKLLKGNRTIFTRKKMPANFANYTSSSVRWNGHFLRSWARVTHGSSSWCELAGPGVYYVAISLRTHSYCWTSDLFESIQVVSIGQPSEKPVLARHTRACLSSKLGSWCWEKPWGFSKQLATASTRGQPDARRSFQMP